MAKKKKPTLSKAILNFIIGVPALFSISSRIASLIGFEARLAGKSLIGIVILAIMCALLLSSIWLCVLAMLFVYLTALQWSTQLVLLTLLGINLVLFMILLAIMAKYKKAITFPETRHMLHDVCRIYEDL